MSTIAPGRLNDVQSAADFVTLCADNFEIISEELFKATPTYQNGAPNTVSRFTNCASAACPCGVVVRTARAVSTRWTSASVTLRFRT
jgi:hypothetical protein